MADKKISQLTSATTLVGTEVMPIVQSGATVKTPVSNVITASAGYTPDGTGAVARSVASKLQESVSVKDFGAVADGVTDCTAQVQLAMNSLSSAGGYVLIPKNVVYDQNALSFVNYVTLVDESWTDGISYNINQGNPGGAVNEFRVVSGFHPGMIIDVHNDWTLGTLGPGQSYSNRASLVYRVNGASIWQVGNDKQGNGTNDFTIYRNAPTSFQAITFTVDGKAIYGQLASGQLFTADYTHNFRGASTSFENSSGNISIILRRNDDSKRKIITLDATADELYITNTANTEAIFTLTNLGHVLAKRGVSGGAFTTTQRNALSVAAYDIGLMVFDTTLGKPVWLKNNTGPVWVDAAGTTV